MTLSSLHVWVRTTGRFDKQQEGTFNHRSKVILGKRYLEMWSGWKFFGRPPILNWPANEKPSSVSWGSIFCSTSTFTRNSPDNNTVALAAVSPVDVLPGSVNCISQILKLYFSNFFQMYLLRYCLWVYFSAAAGVGWVCVTRNWREVASLWRHSGKSLHSKHSQPEDSFTLLPSPLLPRFHKLSPRKHSLSALRMNK